MELSAFIPLIPDLCIRPASITSPCFGCARRTCCGEYMVSSGPRLKMKTCLAVVTLRLAADRIAQDTRAVFSAIPAAPDDIVDEPDIPGIEEFFDACELLDDAAEPHPVAISASPTARKLTGSSSRFPNACMTPSRALSRPERSTISPR